MHQDVAPDYQEPTRAELIEALQHHNATAMRCPRHWVDKLAGIHERMNQILDQMDMLAELEAMSPPTTPAGG